jgi:hypothetical protein
MANTKIDEYQVMYSANAFVPRIWLKSANQFIGQLTFRPNGSPLPPDGMSGGQVNLYYHFDDFENVIDLLRNEKPMYLSYSAPGDENGIMTTPEPVGQGEA